MRKLLLFFCFSFILALSAKGQSYSSKSTDNFFPEIKPFGEGVYCLFKSSPNKSKSPVAVYKKIFLDADLKLIDSVNYSFEGKTRLLASSSNEKFVTHAFYVKTSSLEKIVFIVTDHSGKIQSTFFKTAADFAACFSRPIKNLKYFYLSFVVNNGNPEMLLIQPYQIKSTTSINRGKLYALNIYDGKEFWLSNTPPLYNVRTTDSLLIGLSAVNQTSTFPSYQICFVSKESGKLIKSIPFNSSFHTQRVISVFTTNGKELMLGGSEFESNNMKNGKFFMTMFNLAGEKIFDHVDSASRLSTQRLHLMGSVFDQGGNLVLIGEGWKPDATRMIASTAASVAMAVLTRGAYTRVYAGGLDHKIENVVFATLSPTDGSLKKFKAFPVGPWFNYGKVMTEGSHVLFQVSNQVISYDVNEPDTPPAMFTSLNPNERLVLTALGPIFVKMEKKSFTLYK